MGDKTRKKSVIKHFDVSKKKGTLRKEILQNSKGYLQNLAKIQLFKNFF